MARRLSLTLCTHCTHCTLRTLRTLRTLCVLASLAVSAAPSLAAEPPSATSSPPSDLSIAAHLRRGDKARLGGRWREAAEAYADALAAAERAGVPEEKRAAILGELGGAEVALAKHREGAEHLHRSLEHEEALTTEQRERYRKARAKAAGEVAILIVAVNPADAEVLLDATPIPERRSSHILFVEPGQHTLRARLPGLGDATITQDAPRGSKSTLSLHLPQTPQTPKPPASIPRAAPPERSPPSPCASCGPSEDIAAHLRAGAFITAGIGIGVGAGLLLATIPVENAIDAHRETFGKRAGFSACRSPSYAAECGAQQARLAERAWLTAVGWGTLGLSATVATIAASSYLWAGSDEKKPASVRVTAFTTGKSTGALMIGTW